MRSKMTRILIPVLALAVLVGLAGKVFANGSSEAKYPTRPVTIIVPWAAGGGTDIIARIFGQGLQKQLGVPVNVVNRPGGDGVVGEEAIIHAKPDGYTMGVSTSEITNYTTLGISKITANDFDLISLLGILPDAIMVSTSFPYKTLDATLKAIREHPKNTYKDSGSGVGGPIQIAMAGLLNAAGMAPDRVQFVPSQGGAPAFQDLLAGGITFETGFLPEGQSLMAGGKVRALAVMSEQRSPAFPKIPTVKEVTGLDWAWSNFYALTLPKGVPSKIRSIIIAKAKAAAESKAVKDAWIKRGVTPAWDGPAAFTKFAANYGKTSSEILKRLGLAKS